MGIPKLSSGVNRTATVARDKVKDNEPVGTNKNQPHRISIPGLISQEIGLGDLIKTMTCKVGINPCDGCHRRAAALNQWMVFSPHDKK